MYTPVAFALEEAAAWQLMDQYPFATLVTNHESGMQITHLPLLASVSQRTLRGHFARANPHWQQLSSASRITAIFHGPHHYISPNWYQADEQVPTWNYQAVHAEGTVELVDSTEDVIAILADLSDHQEASFAAPWTMDKLPIAKQQALSRAVVGFRIRVSSLSAKAKLSQNKPTEIAHVVAGLNDARDLPNSALIANAMTALQP